MKILPAGHEDKPASHFNFQPFKTKSLLPFLESLPGISDCRERGWSSLYCTWLGAQTFNSGRLVESSASQSRPGRDEHGLIKEAARSHAATITALRLMSFR